jgi:hypothetical protein
MHEFHGLIVTLSPGFHLGCPGQGARIWPRSVSTESAAESAHARAELSAVTGWRQRASAAALPAPLPEDGDRESVYPPAYPQRC